MPSSSSNNNDYLYSDPPKAATRYPDSLIRLAAVVHRFRVPLPLSGERVCFAKSFETAGRSAKTVRHMKQTDQARTLLQEAAESPQLSADRVLQAAQRYQPLIHTVLVSCQVQPESARLDQKLLFQWQSGMEASNTGDATTKTKSKKKSSSNTVFTSEALMYELCMTVATIGLGHAWSATEQSVEGDFAAAARCYASAAGVFDCLSKDTLPKWVAVGRTGDVNDKASQASQAAAAAALPLECQVTAAAALVQLFQAHGQQMAVATLLVKHSDNTEGSSPPNYTLLAKLCLGIHTQLSEFVQMLRRDAFDALQRLDADFLTLITLQINFSKSLSSYFLARAVWDSTAHGTAIALLGQAVTLLHTRTTTASHGLPDLAAHPNLQRPLQPDLDDWRRHCRALLQTWEADNNAVYFEAVPQQVPTSVALTPAQALLLKRQTDFSLTSAEQPIEPVLLQLTDAQMQRSDSDLARELAEQLNGLSA